MDTDPTSCLTRMRIAGEEPEAAAQRRPVQVCGVANRAALPVYAIQLLEQKGDQLAQKQASNYVASFGGPIYLRYAKKSHRFYRYTSPGNGDRGHFLTKIANHFTSPEDAVLQLQLPKSNIATQRQFVHAQHDWIPYLFGMIDGSPGQYHQEVVINNEKEYWWFGRANTWSKQ